MDIRRLQLWSGRTATVMDNDCVRFVLEDQGGMGIEFSSRNTSGALENSAWVPAFRSSGVSVFSDPNAGFWKHSPQLYQMGGSYFSFPDFGPFPQHDENPDETVATTEGQFWVVERYGTDPASGGIWTLSTTKNRPAKWQVEKIDLLLPGQCVHYTATTVTNLGAAPLEGTAVWSNNIGSPFLESGCLINSCAKTWMTPPDTLDGKTRHLLANGIQFDDLAHIPIGGGRTVDYTVVPAVNGHTDFITGRVPRQSDLGWSSVINPRHQMVFFTFFPGPRALKTGDMPVNFVNFCFNYGGRLLTPEAPYDGGTSRSFSIDCGAGTNMLDMGLDAAREKRTLMGVDTLVTFQPGESKAMFYASAFLPYTSSRISMNFYSVERVMNGLQLKRTKSWAFIACDPEFQAIRALVSRLAEEKRELLRSQQPLA